MDHVAPRCPHGVQTPVLVKRQCARSYAAGRPLEGSERGNCPWHRLLTVIRSACCSGGRTINQRRRSDMSFFCGPMRHVPCAMRPVPWPNKPCSTIRRTATRHANNMPLVTRTGCCDLLSVGAPLQTPAPAPPGGEQLMVACGRPTCAGQYPAGPTQATEHGPAAQHGHSTARQHSTAPAWQWARRQHLPSTARSTATVQTSPLGCPTPTQIGVGGPKR